MYTLFLNVLITVFYYALYYGVERGSMICISLCPGIYRQDVLEILCVCTITKIWKCKKKSQNLKKKITAIHNNINVRNWKWRTSLLNSKTWEGKIMYVNSVITFTRKIVYFLSLLIEGFPFFCSMILCSLWNWFLVCRFVSVSCSI